MDRLRGLDWCCRGGEVECLTSQSQLHHLVDQEVKKKSSVLSFHGGGYLCEERRDVGLSAITKILQSD